MIKMSKEVEIACALQGDRDGGIEAVEELNVRYRDAGGRMHAVPVRWDVVKGLHMKSFVVSMHQMLSHVCVREAEDRILKNRFLSNGFL